MSWYSFLPANKFMNCLSDIDVKLCRGLKEWPADLVSIRCPLVCGYLSLCLQVTLVATNDLHQIQYCDLTL